MVEFGRRMSNNLSEAANSAVAENREELVKGEVWQILARQIAMYTGCESASAPENIAWNLLQSVLFCIKTAEENSKAALTGANTQAVLEAGQRQLAIYTEQGKTTLQEVKRLSLPLENRSYKDTLRELESFFTLYDIRFFAHQIPCMIDYQLCIPVDEKLQGIIYINTYLQHVLWENRFLQHFTFGKIKALLYKYNAEHTQLLINLFEPVLTNALGLAILYNPVLPLSVHKEEARELAKLFHPWEKTKAESLVAKGAATLCNMLMLENGKERNYILQGAKRLLPRLQITRPKYFHNIFLSL